MDRRLLVVPIVHTEAELGSEGQDYRDSFISRHGDNRWVEQEAEIGRYWVTVREALLGLRIALDKVKVYQDSLPDRPETDRLIEDMANHGSPNHQLLQVPVWLMPKTGPSVLLAVV